MLQKMFQRIVNAVENVLRNVFVNQNLSFILIYVRVILKNAKI
jgi:hypothetical protein